MDAMYMNDSYLKEFNAKILEVNNDKFIVLDKSAFYPQGGGQLCDNGKLFCKGEEYKVVFVGKFDSKVSHEVDREGLKAGDEVHCVLDWDRRYTLMRSHTAAHIISQVIHKETGALITGNQLDLDKCRIDFSLDNYDPEKMKDYIEEANKIVDKELPITAEFMTREEAEKIPQLSKLAKGLPENIKDVRVLSIGDFDVQADGGTHVKNTKEVGRLELIKCENKGKNNRRLYFKLI